MNYKNQVSEGAARLGRDIASLEQYADSPKTPPAGFFGEMSSRLEELFQRVRDASYTAERIHGNLIGDEPNVVPAGNARPAGDGSLPHIDRQISTLTDEITHLNQRLNNIETILGRVG